MSSRQNIEGQVLKGFMIWYAKCSGDTTSGRQNKHDASPAEHWQRFTFPAIGAVEMSKAFVSYVAARSEIERIHVESGRLGGISRAKFEVGVSSRLLC